MLRRHDSSAPTVGQLYSVWYELRENFARQRPEFKKSLGRKYEARWAYGHLDLAAAAYLVDPEFHTHQQAAN